MSVAAQVAALYIIKENTMSEDTKPEITEMDVAEVLVEDGAVEMIDGALKLDESLDVAAASRKAGEDAVADAVLAEAAMIGAGRSMALSDAVGEAGIEDIEEVRQCWMRLTVWPLLVRLLTA